MLVLQDADPLPVGRDLSHQDVVRCLRPRDLVAHALQILRQALSAQIAQIWRVEIVDPLPGGPGGLQLDLQPRNVGFQSGNFLWQARQFDRRGGGRLGQAGVGGGYPLQRRQVVRRDELRPRSGGCRQQQQKPQE